MRKLLIILVIPALILVSCEEQKGTAESQGNDEYSMREEMPGADSIHAGQASDGALAKIEIAIEELPDDVAVYVSEDSLLSTLKLTTVHKITKGETSYYDLTFITEDSEDVIVSFDDKGNILQL